MIFKVTWKSGVVSHYSGKDWQDAMKQAGIQNKTGWMKSVKRDRVREAQVSSQKYTSGLLSDEIETLDKYAVYLTNENLKLSAENAELKHALEIVRNHGRG